MNTIRCTIYSVQCTMNIQCIVYYEYTVYSVHYTVYNIQCIVYYEYTVYSVHYTLYNIYCTVRGRNIHRTLYGVHCTPRTVQDVQCTSYNIRNIYAVKCTIQHVQFTMSYVVKSAVTDKRIAYITAMSISRKTTQPNVRQNMYCC